MSRPSKKKESIDTCTLVIFGASGDLTQRKLMPALYALYTQKRLPKDFRVLGVSRTKFTDAAFQKHATEMLDAPEKDFVERLHYQDLSTTDSSAYRDLKDRLQKLHGTSDLKDQNLMFYLSVPPSLYHTIAEGLQSQGLNNGSDNAYRRLVVEKPFGYDIESAQTLNAQLKKVFAENEIYRIDHYLGKETVQNMLVLRFGNGIFEPIWNHHYISHVEITAAESVGVEERGGYYDGAGALRDMVQNHLMQVLGMIAMEPPTSLGGNSLRNESLKVFQSLRPLPSTTAALSKVIIRGQYEGYRDAEDVDAKSNTETYVALKAHIDNWRWAGTPFFIRTGKKLPHRLTEVIVHFKPTPHRLFQQTCSPFDNNSLVLRIQPDEGVLLNFGMKVPGEGFCVQPVDMDFRYKDLSDKSLPEAYERLLLDAMQGDNALYIRDDASEACWEYLDPALKAFADDTFPLAIYEKETWGPEAADKLIASVPEGKWRNTL
jgi:glucose-6-phosphate 1-dehydrogenase